jgi:predicted acetyltransferase
MYAADPDQWREGRSVLRTVLAERDGQAVGFARYRTRNDWGPDGNAGYTEVQQLHADDAAGYAALAGYLLSIDLTAGIKLARQPLDSPLVHLLADFRSAGMRVMDGLYLRLVDVDRALAGRTYAEPVNVVLEVFDGLCPWNAGRWRLAGDEKGATCTRTEEAAELALDVRELASAYLGGATLLALAGAGQVTELRPGAVADASRAFATDLAPWLQFGI